MGVELATSTDVSRRLRRPERRPGAGVEVMVAALLALAAAVLALRLWRASLSVPFEYGPNDSEYQLMLVKGVISTGGWFTNPHLGAPFGQELYDFAVGGDTLHLVLIRLLALFSSNVGVVTNLFYLVSFPLSGAAAYAAIRHAGCSRGASLTSAVLFAILPFALLRGEHHAFLAADYAVPLGAGLALAVLESRPLFVAGTGRRRWLTARTLLTLGACLVVASTGTFYWGTFTIMLLLVAGGVAWWRDGRRAAVAPAVCITAIAFVFALDLAPTLVYQAAHGHDPGAVVRQASESDLYGLKMTQLVLPVPGERIGALARLTQRYDSTTSPPATNESFSSPLGLVGTTGFLALLLALLGVAAGGSERVRAGPGLAAPGLLALAAFLIGTIGGIGTILAYTVTPSLRGWNRISPFIAFFSLLAVARLLDAASARLARRREPPWRRLSPLLPGAVLLLGLFDQTSGALVPDYAAAGARWQADASFVARVERLLPPGAMVYELPYEPFPEGNPLHAMTSYELLRGYLHDDRLRWSFGAIRGRASDWAAQLAQQPLRLQLEGVAAAGFDGVWVDTGGLPPPAGGAIAALARTLQTPPLTGTRDKLAFFDLRPFAARLRAAAPASTIAEARWAVLHPLSLRILPPAPGQGRPVATLSAIVHNPSPTPTPAGLTVYVMGPPVTAVRVAGPGFSASPALRPVNSGSALTRVTVPFPPGDSTLAISTGQPGETIYPTIAAQVLSELDESMRTFTRPRR